MQTRFNQLPAKTARTSGFINRNSGFSKEAVVTFNFERPLLLSTEVPYLHLNVGHLLTTGDPTPTFVTLQRIFRELNLPEKSILSIVPAYLVGQNSPTSLDIPLYLEYLPEFARGVNLRKPTTKQTNMFFLLGPPSLKDRPLETRAQLQDLRNDIRFGLDKYLSILYTYYNPQTYSVHGKHIDSEVLANLYQDLRRELFERLIRNNIVSGSLPYVWNVYPEPQQYMPIQGVPYGVLRSIIDALTQARYAELVMPFSLTPPEELYLRLKPWWKRPIWSFLRRLTPFLATS